MKQRKNSKRMSLFQKSRILDLNNVIKNIAAEDSAENTLVTDELDDTDNFSSDQDDNDKTKSNTKIQEVRPKESENQSQNNIFDLSYRWITACVSIDIEKLDEILLNGLFQYITTMFPGF